MAAQQFNITVGGKTQTVYNKEAVNQLIASFQPPITPFVGSTVDLTHNILAGVDDAVLTDVPTGCRRIDLMFNMNGTKPPAASTLLTASFPAWSGLTFAGCSRNVVITGGSDVQLHIVASVIYTGPGNKHVLRLPNADGSTEASRGRSCFLLYNSYSSNPTMVLWANDTNFTWYVRPVYS